MTYPLKFQRHIRRLVERLRHDFFLGEYAYTLDFAGEAEDDRPGYRERASVVMDGVYLEYTLRVRPSLLEEWRGKRYVTIGRTLGHEMAHLITQPLYLMARHETRPPQDLEEVRERQTQRIANAILDKMPDGWYLPEKGARCRRKRS